MPVDLVDLLGGELHGRAISPTTPAAVLTMELQRGVMGDLASFPALAIAADEVGLRANAAALVTTARHVAIPVLHLTAEFRADRAGTSANTPLHTAVLRRPDHLLEGTPATELIPELGPESSDLIIPRRHGVAPFSGTALDATLRNLGVHTLIVCGVSLNLGVLGLCIEAVDLGYQVLLATDAVCGTPAAYSSQVLENTLSLIATLATTSQVIAAMTAE
jgi:nicotinamidase-related amidase